MAPWELSPGELALVGQLARLDAPALVSVSGLIVAGPGTVYLLHFDRPYKHARHYCGWAPEGCLDRRLRIHARGRGANLLRYVKAAGIGWELARTWTGGRIRERQIKTQGGLSRCCPVCHPGMKVRTRWAR